MVNRAKAALDIVMIILSFVGFGLTLEVYSALGYLASLPVEVLQQIVGSSLLYMLPAALAIFSLLFLMIGIALASATQIALSICASN
jgi:hypothetical protein